jgi:hypothetical protein
VIEISKAERDRLDALGEAPNYARVADEVVSRPVIDTDSLVEVVPSQDGERFGVWCRWSKVGGVDLFLDETGYEVWAMSLARQLRAGLRALLAAGEGVRGE